MLLGAFGPSVNATRLGSDPGRVLCDTSIHVGDPYICMRIVGYIGNRARAHVHARRRTEVGNRALGQVGAFRCCRIVHGCVCACATQK